MSQGSESAGAAPLSQDALDVAVVGAGFAGLYMLHRLRGDGFSVRVFERASGIGGTWFWNRYPGARCDVESLEYSYQFSEALQQEWEWTERYATQPEILRYVAHVADRFDLRRDIHLETSIESARFDAETSRWHLTSAGGQQISARFCVLATGCLSSTNYPRFPGAERFAGDSYHTGSWPPEGVDFTGQRVGVIGTGSSAIQSIPHIAAQAEHLFVFQRTPNYSIPAQNHPLAPEVQQAIKADYPAFRARNKTMPAGLDTRPNDQSALEVSRQRREQEYEARWSHGGLPFMGAFNDLGTSREANDTAREFLHRKIREIVDDPETAELLCPDQEVGCKRICVDTGYFETFNRPNVTLVDVRSAPIEEITADGLRTAAHHYTLDAIVYATGFDAMTGSILRIDIRGREGASLRDAWAAGPRTYLGLATAGFPNLFTVTGPGSPSVLSNMLPSIEQHVDWIADCIGHLREHGLASIEAERSAQDAWVEHVNEVASATIYLGCNSWYLGANVPGKPRVFMPYIGFPPYVAKCEEVVAKGYEGFRLS